MKLSCQIIQDLLPLAQDGVCSQESTLAVSEHLQTCETCRRMAESVSQFVEVTLTNADVTDEKVIRKGLKKIRRRWIASILAVVMIFPLILIGFMIKNEVKEEGICFSVLDELYACERYLSALQDGRYDDAARHVDFSEYFEEIQEALSLLPSDYMATYELLNIDGESYFVNTAMLGKYLSERDFWAAILRDHEPQAPIPETVWKRLDSAKQVYNGVAYLPYQTHWGTFMVMDAQLEVLLEQDAETLYEFFAIMPQAMYEALLPQMQEKAKVYYEGTQQRLQLFRDMDETEFSEYMRSYYSVKLTSDLRITDFEYNNAYYDMDCWYVSYEAELKLRAQTDRIRFTFYVKNGDVLMIYAQSLTTGTQSINLLDCFTPRLS